MISRHPTSNPGMAYRLAPRCPLDQSFYRNTRLPLQLKDGYIDVPTGPGIGWEFDEKKIEKYTVHDFPE